VVFGHHVRDADPAAGREDAEHLGQHLRLVDAQVDHAVGDHDIDRAVGQGNILDRALTKSTLADLRPWERVLDLGCCSPVTGQVLDQANAERMAGALKAIADPTRLRLISMVAASPSGEVCVCDLTGPIGLSQPTVSHHLRILVDGGVLTREQRGKWAYHRLMPEALDTLGRLITTPAFAT